MILPPDISQSRVMFLQTDHAQLVLPQRSYRTHRRIRSCECRECHNVVLHRRASEFDG